MLLYLKTFVFLLIFILMEAHFRHKKKKKKGHCDFLSHNSDFFSKLRDINLQFWEHISPQVAKTGWPDNGPDSAGRKK